jgi:hypothetical protein
MRVLIWGLWGVVLACFGLWLAGSGVVWIGLAGIAALMAGILARMARRTGNGSARAIDKALKGLGISPEREDGTSYGEAITSEIAALEKNLAEREARDRSGDQ